MFKQMVKVYPKKWWSINDWIIAKKNEKVLNYYLTENISKTLIDILEE